MERYLKNLTLLSLSDPDQLKEIMHEQQQLFDEKISKLKLQEQEIELKKNQLLALEEQFKKNQGNLTSREVEINCKEQELRSQEIKIDAKRKALSESEQSLLDYQNKVLRMTKIFEKMESASAAKILETLDPILLSDVISKMKDKKAAEILQNLSLEKSRSLLKKGK
ncbi:MAG: hypothetical protein PHW04_06350 [Candidatus Wallbacteria bacterium]|nr:hypothetical protein [Candidatus Wallbacteria bacterium]